MKVLQRQNELLSARLRELQLRVIRRDETETKIAGILSELRSTIAEIAGAGNLSSERKGGGGSKKGQQDSSFASILRPSETSSVHTATQAIANTSMSKEQEMDAFRLEAEREAHEIVAKKDKVLLPTSAVPTSAVAPSDVANGKAGTKRKTAVPVTRTSEATGPPTEATKESPGASSYAQSPSVAAATPNVLWSKLLGRVTALEAQWSAAQRSARQLVDSADLREQKAFAYVPTLKGSPPLQRTSNNSSRDGSSGESRVQYSARLTPSRSVVNHTFGVQPALVSSADASFSGNHPFGTSNHISAYSSTSSPPHPPPFSARSSVHSVAAAGAELQDSSRLALDLSRVHLLQRDLVAFAESAFAWTSDTVFPAPDISTHTTDVHSRVGSRSNGSRMGGVRDGSAQMPLVLSADQRALGRQQSALALQAASWDLLLHLSCVAPIVPLALDSPLRSSMTGLDALVHEVI